MMPISPFQVSNNSTHGLSFVILQCANGAQRRLVGFVFFSLFFRLKPMPSWPIGRRGSGWWCWYVAVHESQSIAAAQPGHFQPHRHVSRAEDGGCEVTLW